MRCPLAFVEGRKTPRAETAPPDCRMRQDYGPAKTSGQFGLTTSSSARRRFLDGAILQAAATSFAGGGAAGYWIRLLMGQFEQFPSTAEWPVGPSHFRRSRGAQKAWSFVAGQIRGGHPVRRILGPRRCWCGVWWDFRTRIQGSARQPVGKVLAGFGSVGRRASNCGGLSASAIDNWRARRRQRRPAVLGCGQSMAGTLRCLVRPFRRLISSSTDRARRHPHRAQRPGFLHSPVRQVEVETQRTGVRVSR